VSGHPELRPLVEGADLAPTERSRLLAHVRDCAACRADLASHDPSLLFSALALEPVPAEILDRVSRGAASAIGRERRRAATRRVYAWGSLAASILIAGLLGGYVWTQRDLEPPRSPRPEIVDAVRAPAPEPAEPAAMPAAMIEILDSPGNADVVEMTVGDVEVVMIFDREMGI
jgi:hypothetical protein